jgi:hypothetical protein
MPLQLGIPDNTTPQLCQEVWEYCDRFGVYEHDSWDYDIIHYSDSRDEEDAYKGLTDYLLRLGPGFYIQQKASFDQVRDHFVSEVFDVISDLEADYGIVFETEDLKDLVFHKNLLFLWKDATIPDFSSLEDLTKHIDEIKIDGHLIGGVCCTGKWLILPKEENFYGLMGLERLRLRLIEEGRLKKERKTRLMAACSICRCA